VWDVPSFFLFPAAVCAVFPFSRGLLRRRIDIFFFSFRFVSVFIFFLRIVAPPF
jgi:hypothetical protein